MNIWLFQTGELLAINGQRRQRVGLLAEKLVEKGHYVTWWTSTLDHQSKNLIYDEYKEIKISNRLEMIFMHSMIKYKKNVSLRRILNHRLVAKNFTSLSKYKKKPDIVLCSFPTIDLSYEVVKYCTRNKLPVIVDVRDLWPDIFVNPFPEYLHSLIRYFLRGYYKQTKYILNNCDSIIAVSEKYLKWALRYGQRIKTANDQVFPLGYEKNCVNEDEFSHHVNLFSKIGIDPLKKTVWFVGTFGQTYDLGTVIQAARRLVDYRGDIQFVFTGDGEKMNEWANQARGLDNVIFTGWVDKIPLAYLLSIADIGLMAYAKNAPQGLPNKIFEYLSAGIPILSSLQNETKELLEEYIVGRTYQANNVDSFINNLSVLTANHILRNEMSVRGKDIFDQKYSAKVVYEGLVDFIEEQARG